MGKMDNFLKELVLIRKELQAIRRCLEPSSVDDSSERECIILPIRIGGKSLDSIITESQH